MSKNDHQHTEAHHESRYTITDVIITLALARSMARDVKEYAMELGENSPLIKEKIHPVTHGLFDASKKKIETHLPKLARLMNSSGRRFLGFSLTLVALGVHGQHLAHQYKHTQHKVNHQIDSVSHKMMQKYGHFTDDNIRKTTYNAEHNRPY